MSAIVKDMEMPQTCNDCLINCEHSLLYVGITDERHPDCPLIELPPHGRLGDLDALYEEISNGNKAYNGIEGYDGEYQHIGGVDDCLDAIKYADTVIEAEGSET